ncbi:hypothetical protein [uncultured Paraglaciecola sp.]|uniref:hypothetical protein n=1 Tax=uncultured Paraglaciecola sp. TaxID=1765024 RepID=UPI00262C8D34|nr:hypothetical protein [uncultured Paraglaciecola sp.]
MAIETPADLASMMDDQDFADTVTLSDGCTFLAQFYQGYSESLDINGRRPALLCITAQVSGVSVGTLLTVKEQNYAVGAIEQGDRTSRLFLEKRT